MGVFYLGISIFNCIFYYLPGISARGFTFIRRINWRIFGINSIKDCNLISSFYNYLLLVYVHLSAFLNHFNTNSISKSISLNPAVKFNFIHTFNHFIRFINKRMRKRGTAIYDIRDVE